MSERKYQSIIEIQHAIEDDELDTEKVFPFNNKRELILNDENGKTIFSAYYGTSNACVDICTLLGIREPERV